MLDERDDIEIFDASEEETEREAQRHQMRKERAQKMQEEKQRSIKRQRYILLGLALVILFFLLIVLLVKHTGKKNPKDISANVVSQQTETQADAVAQKTETEEPWSFEAHKTEKTEKFPKSVVSSRGILIDVESGDILAAKGAHKRIVPASMTKILTVLVAAEHITPEQMDDKVEITIDITDYSYRNDCSNTGYEVGEKVTVRDLFYGTILPSGADSAVALATYVAGSHEKFVDMMNEKLEEMGLSETTHFTNCVGLYDEDHYSTPYDMAMIIKAATDNEWVREVMSAHTYTTSKTKQHKEGLTVSNWFLRRIEDKDTHGEVLCAKTGFVAQSGSCAASLAADKNGKEYICVTAGSTSSWRCIYDHVELYQKYLPE